MFLNVLKYLSFYLCIYTGYQDQQIIPNLLQYLVSTTWDLFDFRLLLLYCHDQLVEGEWIVLEDTAPEHPANTEPLQCSWEIKTIILFERGGKQAMQSTTGFAPASCTPIWSLLSYDKFVNLKNNNEKKM